MSDGPRGAMHRCAWAGNSVIEGDYHDREWGVPVHDDRRLLEFLILEGAQAGLSWRTILGKRAHYREVFDAFDATRIAAYTPAKITALLADPGIVRNRLKVHAAVANARAALAVAADFGSLDAYLWTFAEGVAHTPRRTAADVPTRTPASDAMSADLRARGFKFVGSTICYAFMQAVGMVNDHLATCFRYYAAQRLGRNIR